MSVSLGAGGIINTGDDFGEGGGAGLHVYDPRQVHMLWGGIPVSDGIAKGTFITVSRNAKSWRLERGSDGEVVRVRSDDTTGIVRLSLMPGSKINSVLSSVAITDEVTGLFAVPMFIKDFSGHSLHTSAFSYIDGMPEKVYAVSPTPVEWTFVCRRLITAIGGSKPAR